MKGRILKDVYLKDFDRKELDIMEIEMPVLMAFRYECGESKPPGDTSIVGWLRLTIQTAIVIKTLLALGVDIRWAPCNIFSKH